MDPIQNPFDESVVESSAAEASQAHIKDPFNESYEPTDTDVVSQIDGTGTENETVTETASSEITDNVQPKPEYPQGVGMQTQGQPFTMPQGGDPNQQQPGVDPNATPQGGANAFNPSENPAGQGFQQPPEQAPQQQAPQQQPPQQQPQQQFNPQQQQPQQPPQQQFNPNQNNGGNFPPQGGGGGFNPNQGGGGGFQQNQGGGGGFQNNNGQEKFAIIDMFWFVNKKLYANQALEQGEAQILTVGFNASFNNMRIGMCSDNGGAFTDTSIIIGNCARLANFNIFSEHALAIVNNAQGTPVRIFERVIKAGSWNPNPSAITNNGNSFLIQSTNTQSGNTYSFPITDEYVIGFQRALEFLLNGQAWNMAMSGQMKR